MIRLLVLLVAVWPFLAQAQAPAAAALPAKVILLGLFHFDNPGLDAVKYTPLDVLKPEPQAYLAALAERLAAFAPTRVVLEYPASSDAVINGRYAEFRQGRFELRKNEIYQLGFRVARAAGLERVHGFDAAAPPGEVRLWAYLDQAPEFNAKLMARFEAESRRQQQMHETKSLREILLNANSAEEDLRNKGLYMLLNPVGADNGLFYGADASADWWQRNLRMYALLQRLAAPGERVLVIAGSGHTAVLRDFLRADGERQEVDVKGFL